MAPRAIPLWENKELLFAVDKAMDLFCQVSKLSRVESSDYDFDQLVSRMVEGALKSEERQRLLQIAEEEPDFYWDITERKLPHSWLRLYRALFEECRCILETKANFALNDRPKADRPSLREVIDLSEKLLFWKIVRQSKALRILIEQTGTFEGWLDKETDKAVVRNVYPSLIFRDWNRLLLIGQCWEKYRIENGLPKAQGCTRDKIKETQHKAPLPLTIQMFEKDLHEREKARELQAPVEAAVWRAQRFWPLINEGRVVPVFDLVRHELLDRLIWQAIKNSLTWTQERRQGAVNWLPRLLPREKNKLLLMALQATNVCAGFPANHNLQKPDEDEEIELRPGAIKGRGDRFKLLKAAITAMPAGRIKEALLLNLGYTDEKIGPDGESVGLSDEEIAIKCGIEIKEVQRLLRAARKWLGDHLNPPPHRG